MHSSVSQPERSVRSPLRKGVSVILIVKGILKVGRKHLLTYTEKEKYRKNTSGNIIGARRNLI